MGKTLVIIGVVVTVVGLLLWVLGPRLGQGGGLLPGDIAFRRGSMSFHFPIATCIVLSVLLTIVLRLFNR